MFNADEFGDLVKIVVDLSREIAQLKRELAGMVKVGTIAETDAQKGYGLDFGKDDGGQSKLSPWLPHPEAGGKAKSWFPLSKAADNFCPIVGGPHCAPSTVGRGVSPS